MQNRIEIYTDGSSLGNPGIGGWGAVLLGKNNVIEIGSKIDDVTNNQMELLSVVRALEVIAEREVVGHEIELFSDSKYFVDGINEWIFNWQKNGWKTAAKKDVLNKDIWQDILRVKEFVELENTINFSHIKAHAGHEHNERADDIARGLAEGTDVELFEGKRDQYKA